MKTQSIVLGAPPYGAAELKQVLRKYITCAAVIAAGIHFSLIGAYWIAFLCSPVHPPKPNGTLVVYGDGPIDIPPPPIVTDGFPPAAELGGATKPDFGNPVPVPDVQVNPGIVFATQGEVNRMDAAAIENGIGNGDVNILVIPEDENEPPVPFKIVEKEPMVVKRVNPEYPEIARQAGLMGKVIANLWIDKKGKVREVRIMHSTSEMFNQSVIDAARQYVFTPAMMNSGPVSVWVAMPFVFKLE